MAFSDPIVNAEDIVGVLPIETIPYLGTQYLEVVGSPGDISGARLADGTIDESKILDGTITGVKIKDGAVTASKISATAIDGKTITGATIRTAASGVRWEMDSAATNEIRAYDGVAGHAPGGLFIDSNSIRVAAPNDGSFITVSPDSLALTVSGGGSFYYLSGRFELTQGIRIWGAVTLLDELIAPYLPRRMLHNTSTYIPTISSGTSVNLNVSFPAGYFTATPTVVAVAGNSSRITCAVTAISTTGFTVNMANWTSAATSNVTVRWIAVQG